MAKRKAESAAPAAVTNGTKKAKHSNAEPVPAKKPALFDDDNSGDESDQGGVPLNGFKINEEYAKRHEHNKKREELQRLEEKYKHNPQRKIVEAEDDEDDSDESTDVEEDDDGFLATEDLDAEISATLQAIRNKDARVYDSNVTFYKPIEEDGETEAKPKAEKGMTLKEYHRQNLLSGKIGDDEEDAPPKTFAQEQEELRQDVVGSMHAAADGPGSDDDDDGFMVRKSKPEAPADAVDDGIHPSRQAKMEKKKAKKVEVNVADADKDPELFLSNFLAARAWMPTEGSRFQPLESDDDEEDARAEAYENAYNLRFEDPNTSNEVLRSYARDVVNSRSVRREEKSSRKKAREAEQERKEAEKRQRQEEKARLRKLKIEQMEEKLNKVKHAAGLRGKALKDEDWTKFLEAGWDDDAWEAEMNKHFGEEYYAEKDVGSGSEDEDGEKKKKPKKPTWDDDIDITDIVPDFKEDDEEVPAFTLTDDEAGSGDEDEEDDEGSSKKRKSSKAIKEEKAAARRAARKERKKIEELVDAELDIEAPLAPVGSSKQASRFRYRETSPTSFGLTARDILLADDKALNEFAGLKKLAAFRDAEKKKKDKKHLSKKARLRQWRKDTFGDEEGPKGGFKGESGAGDGDVEMGDADARVNGEVEKGAVNGVAFGERKKKRRSKKKKSGEDEI